MNWVRSELKVSGLWWLLSELLLLPCSLLRRATPYYNHLSTQVVAFPITVAVAVAVHLRCSDSLSPSLSLSFTTEFRSG